MTSRMLARRPMGLLALAVSATLLIAACDGSDESQASATATSPAVQVSAAAATPVVQASATAMTPAVWAGDVCGAIATWEGSVKTIATDFSDGISKDSLSQKIDAVGQATMDLGDQLVAIGAPETDAGKKAQTDIATLTSEMQAGVEDIKSQAGTLTDSGVGGIQSGLEDIKTEVEQLLKDVRSTFHEIRQLSPANELTTAIQNDEICQSLRPQG